MGSITEKKLKNNLPAINRFITDHNSEGKAVFSDKFDEELPWQHIDDVANFSLGYTTAESPVDFEDGKDLKVYDSFLNKKPGIVLPGGTVVRFVDMTPGGLSPMHRTVSLDYGIVLEGEVELILDSGEKRIMKRGDLAIQRGTMHAWRNTSSTESSRMMYILQESKPIKVSGDALKEDYGHGMPGVPASGN